MVNEMLVALQLCSGSTLRVIDNGLGITLNGLEEEIVDFALLGTSEEAYLPSYQGSLCDEEAGLISGVL